MKPKTILITKIIIVAAAALLIGWDIYVAVNPVEGDTISEVILGWSKKYLIAPFAAGVLCGHLFWPQRVKAEGKKS